MAYLIPPLTSQMLRVTSRFVSLLFCLSMLQQSVAEESAIRVIVSADIAVTEITNDQLRKLFLGKRTELDDKTVVVAINKSPEVYESFVRGYLRKSPRAFRTYWRKMLFTGKGVEPISFATDEDVMLFVSRNAGVIAYVSSEAVLTENVKVITVQP